MALPHSTLFPSPPPGPYKKAHLPFSSISFSSQETTPSTSLRSKISYSSSTYIRRRAARWSITSSSPSKQSSPKLRILIAGGGIGGLVLALAARRKGFDAVVFEKDLSAIRGEGQYRGPIQIQSNALAALEAIDMDAAEEVMAAACITGDRINGLVDGISGTWYIKFDTFTPAVERGLPVTRVVSRMKLQQILARAVGNDVILNGSNVIDFVDDGTRVTVTLENGQRFEGDLLVGADGIWSKIPKMSMVDQDENESGNLGHIHPGAHRKMESYESSMDEGIQKEKERLEYCEELSLPLSSSISPNSTQDIVWTLRGILFRLHLLHWYCRFCSS